MGEAIEQVLRSGFELVSGDTRVRLARPSELEPVSELFDAYRVFYRQPSDRARARRFIEERCALRESVILVVEAAPDRLAGFAQLFPSFTSAGTARSWILNDLFVHPERRRAGVGRALVSAALALGRQVGAASISLATEQTNVAAQRLYESLGFQRDTTFLYYRLQIE